MGINLDVAQRGPLSEMTSEMPLIMNKEIIYNMYRALWEVHYRRKDTQPGSSWGGITAVLVDCVVCDACSERIAESVMGGVFFDGVEGIAGLGVVGGLELLLVR
jgi:hypothetical protein